MRHDNQKAILAGDGFWGVQDLVRRQPGVISTWVGYTGGEVPNATYRNHHGHAEAIEITFDPEKTSYRDLLEFFFQIHDPTTKNRQGSDIGTSYRSAIFYPNDEQRGSPRTPSPTWTPPACAGQGGHRGDAGRPVLGGEPEHQDYLERYPDGYTCHFVRPDWKLPRRTDRVTS